MPWDRMGDSKGTVQKNMAHKSKEFSGLTRSNSEKLDLLNKNHN